MSPFTSKRVAQSCLNSLTKIELHDYVIYLIIYSVNSDQEKSLSYELADSLELSHALFRLNGALAVSKVQANSQLQILKLNHSLSVSTSFNPDLLVTIEIKFSDNLFNYGVIRDTFVQLHHLAIRLFAIKQLEVQVR